eukprot:symbB.v1.2.036590.t1/scaffold5200.1/size29896/3
MGAPAANCDCGLGDCLFERWDHLYPFHGAEEECGAPEGMDGKGESTTTNVVALQDAFGALIHTSKQKHKRRVDLLHLGLRRYNRWGRTHRSFVAGPALSGCLPSCTAAPASSTLFCFWPT